MATAVELEEYLAEIREHVCSHCVERLPGGPPCKPLGKLCGVEQNLPQLIEAVHAIRSGLIEPYWDSTQRQVCEHCSLQHSRFCPCPMSYLLVLVVEAVEAVDARHERRELGRWRLAGLEKEQPDVREIRLLYEEAAGTWTGCDWPTRFGTAAFDLNGWTAAEAQRKAAHSKSTAEGADWVAAAEWLANVERVAEQAEAHAARAVRAAVTGDWLNALKHARQAWLNEFSTGRMLWRGFPMTWQRLFLAVEEAVTLHPSAADADQAEPSR